MGRVAGFLLKTIIELNLRATSLGAWQGRTPRVSPEQLFSNALSIDSNSALPHRKAQAKANRGKALTITATSDAPPEYWSITTRMD